MSEPVSLEVVQGNIEAIRTVINDEYTKLTVKSSTVPLLCVVSKTKSPEVIMHAYTVGVRDFGENYIQELVGKAKQLPSDIKWHAIGHVQSNKVKELIENVPNLYMIETIDSAGLADKFQKKLEEVGRTVNYLMEIRTSPEESKIGGVDPAQVMSLYDHISKKCKNMNFMGFMTVEEPGNYGCFDRLVALRQSFVQSVNSSGGSVNEAEIVLSMGMTDSYVEAIRRGSSEVRIGSAIFGPREKKIK